MIETRRIPLQLIDDTHRLRWVNPDWAAVMADDVSRGVELPPILVRPARPDEVTAGCTYELVIGGHRMEAHRLAGREDIRADIEEMSRDQAILREAEENLKRNNPSALEKTVFLTARDEAHKRLYPETGRGGDRRSAAAIKRQELPFEGAVSYAADAAHKVGLGERSIRVYIAVGRKLPKAIIPALYQTEIAKKLSELEALVEHGEDEQAAIVHDVAAGNARTVAQARVSLGLASPIERNADEQLYLKLVDLWSRAPTRVQQRFTAHAKLVLGNSRAGT